VSDRYRVRLTSRARRDLAQIRAWLTQPGSGPRGRRRYAAVIEALLELETKPLRWPLGDHADMRERPVESHRIVYSVDPTAKLVQVRRIFSPFQDRSSL